MINYLSISSYIRKPFLICDFANAPLEFSPSCFNSVIALWSFEEMVASLRFAATKEMGILGQLISNTRIF
jgi:hypothetical protein